MIEAEKRARHLRRTTWVVGPMVLLPWLVLRAFKLHDGVISASDFLWYAAIAVPSLLLVIFAPFLEDRRLRRLKQRCQEQRRPFLNLEA